MFICSLDWGTSMLQAMNPPDHDLHLSSFLVLDSAIDLLRRISQNIDDTVAIFRYQLSKLEQDCDDVSRKIDFEIEGARSDLDSCNGELRWTLDCVGYGEEDEEDDEGDDNEQVEQLPDTGELEDRIALLENQIADLTEKYNSVRDLAKRVRESALRFDHSSLFMVSEEAYSSRKFVEEIQTVYTRIAQVRFTESADWREEYDLGPGFWRESRVIIGKGIDNFLGQNIPSNSKTIDKTIGSDAVSSFKSTDLRLRTYQNLLVVRRMVRSWIERLNAYRGETRADNIRKVTFVGDWGDLGPQGQRLLEWFIPSVKLSEELEELLKELEELALGHGVELRIYRIKDYI